MTKTYYECHVTLKCPEGKEALLKYVIEDNKWKFSKIDGDIVEGDGVKCYATRHYNATDGQIFVIGALLQFAEFLSKAGFEVTRRKVEHVIFDDRSSKVCPDSCVGCIAPTE